MVQVTQTEDEIRITIRLNCFSPQRPDIVLMPKYLKCNIPPIFYERHLTQEIDEVASYCRVLKTEARIVLIKKKKGIWPEIFQVFSKEELFKKRLEIADQIIARNKERDIRTLERYEQKRRLEVEREVQRETAMRERVREFQERACREIISATPKETDTDRKIESAFKTAPSAGQGNYSFYTPSQVKSTAKDAIIKTVETTKSLASAQQHPIAPIRPRGTINVSFSNFIYATPKRESQEGKPRPFVIEDNPTNNSSDTINKHPVFTSENN